MSNLHHEPPEPKAEPKGARPTGLQNRAILTLLQIMTYGGDLFDRNEQVRALCYMGREQRERPVVADTLPSAQTHDLACLFARKPYSLFLRGS